MIEAGSQDNNGSHDRHHKDNTDDGHSDHQVCVAVCVYGGHGSSSDRGSARGGGRGGIQNGTGVTCIQSSFPPRYDIDDRITTTATATTTLELYQIHTDTLYQILNGLVVVHVDGLCFGLVIGHVDGGVVAFRRVVTIVHVDGGRAVHAGAFGAFGEGHFTTITLPARGGAVTHVHTDAGAIVLARKRTYRYGTRLSLPTRHTGTIPCAQTGTVVLTSRRAWRELTPLPKVTIHTIAFRCVVHRYTGAVVPTATVVVVVVVTVKLTIGYLTRDACVQWDGTGGIRCTRAHIRLCTFPEILACGRTDRIPAVITRPSFGTGACVGRRTDLPYGTGRCTDRGLALPVGVTTWARTSVGPSTVATVLTDRVTHRYLAIGSRPTGRTQAKSRPSTCTTVLTDRFVGVGRRRVVGESAIGQDAVTVGSRQRAIGDVVVFPCRSVRCEHCVLRLAQNRIVGVVRANAHTVGVVVVRVERTGANACHEGTKPVARRL